MKLAAATLFAAGLLALSSCASIINGKTSTVEIVSTPPGATFTGNYDGVSGVTPAVVDLPNGKPVTISFQMDGYIDSSMVSKPHMSGWVIGNIIFGGIIGIVIDIAGNGAYIHKDMDISMLPVGHVEPVEEDIQVAEKPAQNWSRKPDNR